MLDYEKLSDLHAENFMQYIFIFFITLISSSRGLGWSEPDFTSCDFYPEAETSMRCHNRGSKYLLDYGYYYCQKFKEKSSSWSETAEIWANSTGQCLQEMLFDNRENRLSNCEQLEEFAFDSHPICYKQYGFCNLQLNDKFKIFSTIRAIDLISRKSLSQSLNLLLACGKDLWIPAEEATFHQLAKITTSYTNTDKKLGEKFFLNAPTDSKEHRKMYFYKAISLLLGMDINNYDSNALDSHIAQFNHPGHQSGSIDSKIGSDYSVNLRTFTSPARLKEILSILSEIPTK